MASKQEILNEAAHLIASLEGFRDRPYWDVRRYSWGYGTQYFGTSPTTARITNQDALKELENYLNGLYNDYVKAFPKLANDLIAIPLLSKGYQYGSGIYSSLNMYEDDLNKLIFVAFYDNEKYPERRATEIEFYFKLLEEKTPALLSVILLSIVALIFTKLINVINKK